MDPSHANAAPDEAFVAALPKAELHLHLEGTVTPETWLALIRRHDPRSPVTLDDLRARLRFSDMDGFFDAWMALLGALRGPEDYRLVALGCGRALAAQNVRYAELHTSVAGAEWSGRLRAADILPAIADGLDEAKAEGGPDWRLIVDVIRDVAADGHARLGLDIALAHRRLGVAGVGLGGSEALYPELDLTQLFAEAKGEGLGVTVHAGEATGPATVRRALEMGADRIGHAVTAVRDPDLLEEIVARGVHLELCPTSNVRTGAVPSLQEHPVGAYVRRGLHVSLNTDDPAFFGTDLNGEYLRVARAFGLSRDDLARLARNAFEAAFALPEVPSTEDGDGTRPHPPDC